MTSIRFITLVCILGLLIIGCRSQVENTPVQSSPIVVVITKVITSTPHTTVILQPSLTPQPTPTEGLMVWETPPSEILLNFNPTKQVPPPAKFTETVAQRKFQFTHPIGFLFSDSSHGSLMENKEKSIIIQLELFDHQGKVNASESLNIMLDGKSYWATSEPEQYSLAEYTGLIVEVQTPLMDNGIGQIIMVDVDSQNLFYAIGIAKEDKWEPEGQQIFMDVINSITFSDFR